MNQSPSIRVLQHGKKLPKKATSPFGWVLAGAGVGLPILVAVIWGACSFLSPSEPRAPEQFLGSKHSMEIRLPVAMAEDPLSTVVLGAGKMLSNFELLRKISLD